MTRQRNVQRGIAMAIVGIALAAVAVPSALGAPHGARARVEAYFLRESYRPGTNAILVASTNAPWFSIQIFQTGGLPIRGLRRDELNGTAVTERRRLNVRSRGRAQRFVVPLGDSWVSGMYYAELRAPNGDIGYAPLIVRPRRLGERRVAVVMPTNTWQAYNRRDADGDGTGDTWYADWRIHTVDMTRPFLDRGVPPYFSYYDRPFIRWLSITGKEVDFLSDRDLMTVGSGSDLATAYELIVFPGHHEYVTTHEYNVVERYRNLGGHLMFLSANNFFWRVTRHGDSLRRMAEWRDLGRPESALIGVQYIGNDRGEHRGAYTVRNTDAGQWIFDGTGLEPGDRFGSFGIEIDATTKYSPPQTQVLAEIPHLLGRLTAQMSYYETSSGAKVFAAGAFTLGGSALQGVVSQLLENLWARLGPEQPAPEPPEPGPPSG